MSFDKPTRNALASMVGDCRGLLTADIRHQFQAVYGLQPDGTALKVSSLGHLDEHGREIAQELRDWQEHVASIEAGPEAERTKAAFDRLANETAFTVLNRLAALRLCEERGHVIECVRRGMESDGFVLYERFSGGLLGSRGETYRVFLERLFDELAVDLGALFDPVAPQSLVFPGERCLGDVLALLHKQELAHLWTEDETIGWIYQYFNSKDEREAMRNASPAPRNSREVAVRNQFFTPRYVVEFLTDNTLARIWYEMTQSDTRLRDQCRYLVQRPNEIFLQPGESALDVPRQDNLSQDQLLKQPVHIPYRSVKDPRAIRMLDPACGSMHFGLYAFDLFEVIYDEAWEITHGIQEDWKSSASFAPFMSFAAQYPDKAAFLCDVPRLIIEHNLHGIDIDPRAVQIAGLSLWLRAQRAWQQQGLRPQERPCIRRSNIVCAEPMPGEEAFLNEFIEAHLAPTPERKLLGQLVRRVFDAMKLAGEAGSLLKIEVEIGGAVAEAKQKWLSAPKLDQGRLFAEDTTSPIQRELGFDVTGITDEVFWQKAEERIYAAIQSYAEQAERSGGYQRRLFADDAARGFAFLDLFRKRYDVVVMNPPFGDRPQSCERYFQSNFTETANDFYSMFFERSLGLADGRGKIGAITNRTWLSLPSFEGLRTRVFSRLGCVEAAADLGSFVLDAQVETAAVIIGRDYLPEARALWVRLLKKKAKSQTLLEAVGSVISGRTTGFMFLASQRQFTSLPLSVCGYWMSPDLISLYRAENSINARAAEVKQGIATADDPRFLRLVWEIPPSGVGLGKDWVVFAKGGEYSNFFDDIHLALNWKDAGREIIAWGRGRPQNIQYFGRCGVTWPRRTTSPFGPRALPAGCAFGDKGPAAFPLRDINPSALLGLLVARPTKLLLSVRLGAGDDAPGSASKSYEVGLIRDLPFPEFGMSARRLEELTSRCTAIVRLSSVEDDETTTYFIKAVLLHRDHWNSLRDAAAGVLELREARFEELTEYTAEIDEIVAKALGFGDVERQVMWEELEPPIVAFAEDSELDTGLFRRAYLTKEALPGESLPGGLDAEADVRVQTRRKQQVNLRDAETICRLFEIPPRKLIKTRRSLALLRDKDLVDITESLASYLVGCAFGRWDIRFATGEKPTPELPDPFVRMPICPLGQLQNQQGLPIAKEEVQRLNEKGRWDYPIEIPWDGILVDDPGHPLDIEARLHELLQVIRKDRWEAIEREACEILGVRTLREYFRKPAGFFADHLKRYSKSRRQAPIYWPLCTVSGSYTLWVYYHRLTAELLFTAVNKFVKPQIEATESQIRQIEFDLQSTSGQIASNLRNTLDSAKSLLDELRDFRDELLRVADLPYRPNLNDGALITASPLWKLFRLPKWRADLKECWEKLSDGKYDWAHLAYSMWPDRVRDACKRDRSIAIAHGLETLCEVPVRASAKRKSTKAMAAEMIVGDDE